MISVYSGFSLSFSVRCPMCHVWSLWHCWVNWITEKQRWISDLIQNYFVQDNRTRIGSGVSEWVSSRMVIKLGLEETLGSPPMAGPEGSWEQLCFPVGLASFVRPWGVSLAEGREVDVAKSVPWWGAPAFPASGASFPRLLQVCFVKHPGWKLNNHEMNPIIEDALLLIRALLVKSQLMVVPPCAPVFPSLSPCPLGLIHICRGRRAGLCLPLMSCWD